MDNEIKEIIDRLNEDKEEIRHYEYYPDDVLTCEELVKLIDYITNSEQKVRELECDLEELTYSYNQLEKELKNKKEQCDNLIEHINPYQYYGLNENDYH